MRKKTKLLILAFLLWSQAALFADTVFLRNGQVLEGAIVGQSRTEIRIAVQGQVRTVQKTDIARVVFANPDDAKKAEEARKQEEAKKAEEARKGEDARKAEEVRRAEEARRKQESDKGSEARRREEAAARARVEAEEAKHRRMFLDMNFELGGATYRGMHEGSINYLETFIRTQAGTGRGFSKSINPVRDEYGAVKTAFDFVWNRWRASLSGIALSQTAMETRLNVSQTSDGNSGGGAPVQTLRTGVGLREQTVDRTTAAVSGGYSFLRSSSLEVYAGAGYMRIKSSVAGSTLLAQRDVDSGIRELLVYESRNGESNKVSGAFLEVGGTISDITPLPIIFSIRGYSMKGESTFLLEALQASDMLRFKASFEQKYTGWEYSIGTKYALGEHLSLDGKITIQRAKAVPSAFALTDITIQSYDISKPPPVGPGQAVVFGALANVSFNNGSPYVDRFGAVTLGLTKRLDF